MIKRSAPPKKLADYYERAHVSELRWNYCSEIPESQKQLILEELERRGVSMIAFEALGRGIRMIARRAPPKKRRGKPRRGPLRDLAYRKWIARHRCCVCWGVELDVMRADMFITQAAHTEKGGMSQKGPDSSCAPMCPYHHDWYDGRSMPGDLSVDEFFHINMKAIAGQYWAYYQKFIVAQLR